MREVTAYRCDHCGKVYLHKHQCRNHEPLCTLNPQTRPLCYSCQHYQEADPNDKVKIYIGDEVAANLLGYDDYESIITYSPNKCAARKEYNNRFLFNKRKQSKRLLSTLLGYGFIPMPSKKSGGCKEYKPIEGHPYAYNEQE